MIQDRQLTDGQDLWGQQGPIALAMQGFEPRPQQAQMARAIERAFAGGRHLAVEAGTGVGKSFAYLIPVIQHVVETERKAVVSTFTITLQEQLIHKDIPFLQECLPYDVKAILAKGRGNYLCMRRLDFAARRQQSLFGPTSHELDRIRRWSMQTTDGSLSDLPFLPSRATWEQVRSEHGNCPGRKCAQYSRCFYRRARRQWNEANLVVANHALLFSDLALKEQKVALLPDYSVVVIDEAHNVERVAEEHFGINITNHRARYLLDELYNARTHRGLLVVGGSAEALQLVEQTREAATEFFRRVEAWFEAQKDRSNGRCPPRFIKDTLSVSLQELRKSLATLAKQSEDQDQQFELTRSVGLCDALTSDLHEFLTQEPGEGGQRVYWVEAEGKMSRTVRLRAAPLNVGPDVQRCLFEKYSPVILTSATLSTGATGGFDFFAGRIGLKDYEGLHLDSPFDYRRQVTLYIERGLPNPNDPEFLSSAAEVLKRYLLKTSGRAFLLFTSYRMLDDVADQLEDWLAEQGFTLLRQGADLDRSAMIRQFKANDHCVLFGTDSFWQGVDVPGQALSNVTIMRLPFAVPDQPLLAGRLEQIREQGGNPFMDYQLPSAIIKFKQGFGRLIRSRNDTGIVVVLDSRIISKRYGQSFLAAVPDCRIEVVDGLSTELSE